VGVLQDPGPEMSFSDPPSETFPGKVSTKVSGNDDFTAVFFPFLYEFWLAMSLLVFSRISCAVDQLKHLHRSNQW